MDIETKIISPKKLARLEKKQKKMLAYLEVAKLNDQDRDRAKHALNDKNEAHSDSLISEDEPSCKKIKTEDSLLIENNWDNYMYSDMCSKNFNTPSGKPPLNGEEYIKLKLEMKERKTRLRHIPRFRLKDVGEQASISVLPEDRTPIFLSDVQHLILFTSLGNHTPYFPQRWCSLDKQSRIQHCSVLVIENVSLYHYTSNESSFSNLNTIFENKLEIVTPSVYRGDLVEEIAAVPLTSTQKDKLVKEYGSLETALQSYKVFSMLKAVFPVRERIKIELEKKMILPGDDKFPRTHLLLSAWQMVEENYPLPLKGSLKYKYANYVLTKDTYEEVTPNSPMFAIDCEMCRTTTTELELTRVSVVNEKHEVLYEKFVKPHHRIVDYLTRYSGITAEILKSVTTRLEDVQRDLRELLPADAILVGQSLNSDLHALKIMHPYVIDTSVIFNVTGDRFRKTKLRTLAKEFLDESIQEGHAGHCSIEDSLSSLKLVQLKLKHYIEFGDAVLSGQKGCLRNYRLQGDNYYGSSMLHHITKIDKKAGIFCNESNVTRYKKYIHKNETASKPKIVCIPKESNNSIMKQACEQGKAYDVSVAHLSIGESELLQNNIQKTCQSVDKWIKKIWSNISSNSLCVVVFGGEIGGNGACFIQIKRDQHFK